MPYKVTIFLVSIITTSIIKVKKNKNNMHTNTFLRHMGIALGCLCLITACHNQPRQAETVGSGIRFTHEHRLPTTPVKDQGHSELCWAYAMLATIETEHLVQADSVNLSPHYMARQWLQRQAVAYRLSTRHRPISMRGMAPMALHLLREEGAMPYDSYWTTENINYKALARRAMMAADATTSLAELHAAVDRLCNQTVGYLPKHIYMLGAKYSPLDFAQSVCLRNEWRAYTSVTHHPFYTDVPLEMDDNQLNDRFYNLPIDTLVQYIKQQLHSGHPVCWEGDISEPGFNWPAGLAYCPTPEPERCQQVRQQLIERRLTTDDHCLCLVGTAQGSDGQLWFIAKNSWGTHNARHGFIYLSEGYVRMKTIAVVGKRDSMSKTCET